MDPTSIRWTMSQRGSPTQSPMMAPPALANSMGCSWSQKALAVGSRESPAEGGIPARIPGVLTWGSWWFQVMASCKVGQHSRNSTELTWASLLSFAIRWDDLELGAWALGHLQSSIELPHQPGTGTHFFSRRRSTRPTGHKLSKPFDGPREPPKKTWFVPGPSKQCPVWKPIGSAG